MNHFSLRPPFYLEKPIAGQLLIAEPLLHDDNFSRSVILLCEHSSDGSVGFILNQLSGFSLQNLMPNISQNGPQIFKGGPVQKDTLHMIHKAPHILGNGMPLVKNVYWGGSFDSISEIESSAIDIKNDLRLFLGYSGWAPGQLEDEIKEGTWLITNATEEIIFDTNPKDIWKKAIALLGKQFEYLMHIPTDPQLN